MSAIQMESAMDDLRRTQLLSCEGADRQWEVASKRNIVLLFDGTGNILGNHQDTNVVKLLRVLVKHAPTDTFENRQIVYYDPGVGTTNNFPCETVAGKISITARRLAGLALGGGVFENIAEAYAFLIKVYQDGDRIFLFGFSRGAFTARALGGMINSFGLIQETGIALIPSIVQSYFSPADSTNRAGKDKKTFAEEICKEFSLGRTPWIHFTGVWDTVETIGSGLLGGVRITNSRDLAGKRFRHVRHALSLHESRCKYEPRKYVDPIYSLEEENYRSFKQEWFRGVHSDVGGSYTRDGLSNISLNWMIREASGCGLLIAKHHNAFPEDPNGIMHDQTYESPYWAWTGLAARPRSAADVVHDTALPLEQARPASLEPRKNALLTTLALALFVVCIATALLCLLRYIQIGKSLTLGPAHQEWAAMFPLLAAWLGPEDLAKLESVRLRYLIPESIFFTCFVLWLAMPMTFALRRIIGQAILAGANIPTLARRAQWVMVACLASGIAKIVCEFFIAERPWHIACFLASVINLISYFLLGIIFVHGVLAGKTSSYSARRVTSRGG